MTAWKKRFYLLPFCLVSVFGFSQQLELDLQRKMKRVKRIVSRMESRIYEMSERQLIKADEKMSEVLSILRPGQGGGRPGQLITVTGSVERRSFVYSAVDALDLAKQCVNEFQNYSGSVDEASVSVNFEPASTVKTVGWWTGPGEYCGVIAQKAIQQGLPMASKYSGFGAVGTIEKKSFSFEGTLGEIFHQCQDFYKREVVGSSDEFYVFDGVKGTKKKTVGWWQNSAEVCNLIIQQIK